MNSEKKIIPIMNEHIMGNKKRKRADGKFCRLWAPSHYLFLRPTEYWTTSVKMFHFKCNLKVVTKLVKKRNFPATK